MAVKISQNLYKGEPITNPMDLLRLVEQRKSVYHTNWGVVPAAVVLSMQFKDIAWSINAERLFYVVK